MRPAEYPCGWPKVEATPETHEAVRLGTYYVLQCLRAARAALSVGTGIVLSGPAPRDTTGAVPFGLLPEARTLALEPRACALPLAGTPPTPGEQWGLLYFGPDCASLRGMPARDQACGDAPSRRTAPALARGVAWAAASRGRRTLPALSGSAALDP